MKNALCKIFENDIIEGVRNKIKEARRNELFM